ncbi:MAG: DUF167 domain-containing protein [Candidatus Omnitrophota bacterium]
MRISVKVKASTKQERVEKIDETNYFVWVREKPVEGKANQAVMELLAEYFDIAKSKIILLKGQTAKNKVFDVEK